MTETGDFSMSGSRWLFCFSRWRVFGYCGDGSTETEGGFGCYLCPGHCRGSGSLRSGFPTTACCTASASHAPAVRRSISALSFIASACSWGLSCLCVLSTAHNAVICVRVFDGFCSGVGSLIIYFCGMRCRVTVNQTPKAKCCQMPKRLTMPAI